MLLLLTCGVTIYGCFLHPSNGCTCTLAGLGGVRVVVVQGLGISQFFVDAFVTFLPHALLAAIFILQSDEISLCSHFEVHTDSA